jgi:hypothetical protein
MPVTGVTAVTVRAALVRERLLGANSRVFRDLPAPGFFLRGIPQMGDDAPARRLASAE